MFGAVAVYDVFVCSASRANAKEYSNLEDHAIVAWVSAGARASLVGGNRVWRELQEQYPRLTGRGECACECVCGRV